MPVTLQHVDEEKLDAAVTDAHGGRRPFIDVLAMEEIVLEFRLGDLVRRFSIKVDEHTYGTGVALLCTLAHARKLQGSHGLLIIVFHHESPFLKMGLGKQHQGYYDEIRRDTATFAGY